MCLSWGHLLLFWRDCLFLEVMNWLHSSSQVLQRGSWGPDCASRCSGLVRGWSCNLSLYAWESLELGRGGRSGPPHTIDVGFLVMEAHHKQLLWWSWCCLPPFAKAHSSWSFSSPGLLQYTRQIDFVPVLHLKVLMMAATVKWLRFGWNLWPASLMLKPWLST